MDIPWVKLIWEAHYQNNEAPHTNPNKGSFWWKDCMKMFDLFKEMSTCEIRAGNTCKLWDDSWNGEIMYLKFPELHSFCIQQIISINRSNQEYITYVFPEKKIGT